MATSRFIKDSGLTVRMTSVMFLLGGLFVALVVGLMYVAPPQYSVLIGLAGIAVAFWQWWNSDKVAMRAMRAREVTPEEAPELHGMIDRLCALADMPKPRVGVADMGMPNAFATGRSPDRAVVTQTTGILRTLDAEELEAVLSHELSHVAHRDVLVMTVASSAGIAAGMLMRGAQYGGLGRSRNHNRRVSHFRLHDGSSAVQRSVRNLDGAQQVTGECRCGNRGQPRRGMVDSGRGGTRVAG